MQISIANPIQATYIFSALFFIALIILVRRKNNETLFPNNTSQELKGFAILAIIFSHIGYFLVDDTRFLWPLSILAGVGVNLFLFLSGYGLTASAIKKPLPILQSYKRRLLKLFKPLWIILGLFLLLDFFVLGTSYDWGYILRSVLGYFPRADLFSDLNSPLWYFTLILFYYLLFPILFSKKRYWLSAIILYLIPAIIIKSEPEFLKEMLRLYEVHLLAFPLGIIVAGLISQKDSFKLSILSKRFRAIIYYLSLAVLITIAIYTAYHSGVGESPRTEELTSLITMAAILGIFLLKKIEFKLFYIFGIFSYEIYLLHWPILSRYDIFFRFLPAWLALSLYLLLFLGLAWLLQQRGKISKALE